MGVCARAGCGGKSTLSSASSASADFLGLWRVHHGPRRQLALSPQLLDRLRDPHVALGLATLVIAPLTGLAALRFDERWQRRKEALRGVWVASQSRRAAALAQARRDLCAVVEAALNSQQQG